MTVRRKTVASSPRSAFAYLPQPSGGARLHCDQVSLDTLARRFGTPLYAYSSAEIVRRFRAFNSAFEAMPHSICYSVKANSNIAILRLLAREGSGFDVVSGGELERVELANPRSAKKVVFSGVGKTETELRAALKAGILLFNVESESELRALEQCARNLRKIAPIAVRVNPDVSADTHPHISTGLSQHKFGVSMARAMRLYATAAASEWLHPAGVSVHIGSQITDVKPFAATMERVADFVLDLRSQGLKIVYVDAGGGLGIPYAKNPGDESISGLTGYARAIMRPLRGLNVHLLLEPGRALVGPAGVLVTRVTYRKQNVDKTFLVVDAGMNDFVRPTLYNAHHEIIPVVAQQANAMETADIVGPVCETGDFFARDRELPLIQEGALLAVLDAGAYGMSLSSNYNSRARAAEVLVSGKGVKLVRRRETFKDLVRQEV